jgi:pimeloyl-ACP methyl ester carboxylesterase
MWSRKVRQINLVILTMAGIILNVPDHACAETKLITEMVQASQQAPPPERPQTPKSPFPYKQREVTYPNLVDKIQLAGTLTVPSDKGPHPAVILLPGSGPVDRNATMLPGHKPFLVIADYLTRRGVAVLRVDDRGAGNTTGKYLDSTGENFANDVLASIDFLKKQSEVDARRIGLIGHSQGGMIAPMVAARSTDISFVIMLAAPILPDRVNSRLRLMATLRAKGTSEDEIKRHLDVADRFNTQLREGADDAALRSSLRELIKASHPSGPALAEKELDNIVEQQLPRLHSRYVRFFIEYDPRVDLKRLAIPVLAISGSLDQAVPPNENLNEFEKVLGEAGNKDATAIELYGINHLMQTATTGDPLEMMKIEETFSPKVLELMAAWIRFRARVSQDPK